MLKEKLKNIWREQDYKRLVNNFLYLLILQLSSVLIPFILFPHLTSVLSDSNFGLIILSLSLTQFLSVVIDFGYNLSATPIIAMNEHNQARLSFVFCNAMYARGLLMILTFFLFLVGCLVIPSLREDFWFHQISFSFVIGSFLFPVWFFQGMQQMKFITIVGLITKGLSTLLAFIFIQQNEQYILYPFFLGGASILSGLFAIVVIFRVFHIKLIPVRVRYVKTSLRQSAGFFFSRLSASYLLFINPFLLSIFSTKAIVGYYGIAEKFYNFFQQAYRPVVAVLYPYMAQKRDTKFFRVFLVLLIVTNALICVASYLYIETVLNFMFTEVSEMTVQAFRILVVAAFFFVPSQMLGYPYLSALGFGRQANASIIIVTFLHALLLLLLMFMNSINIFTLSGLMIAVQLGVLILRSFYIYKNKLSLFHLKG